MMSKKGIIDEITKEEYQIVAKMLSGKISGKDEKSIKKLRSIVINEIQISNLNPYLIKSLLFFILKMGIEGVEPSTPRASVVCSPAELYPQKHNDGRFLKVVKVQRKT